MNKGIVRNTGLTVLCGDSVGGTPPAALRRGMTTRALAFRPGAVSVMRPGPGMIEVAGTCPAARDGIVALQSGTPAPHTGTGVD